MDAARHAIQMNAHGHALGKTDPRENRIDIGEQFIRARRIVAIHDPARDTVDMAADIDIRAEQPYGRAVADMHALDLRLLDDLAPGLVAARDRVNGNRPEISFGDQIVEGLRSLARAGSCRASTPASSWPASCLTWLASSPARPSASIAAPFR